MYIYMYIVYYYICLVRALCLVPILNMNVYIRICYMHIVCDNYTV